MFMKENEMLRSVVFRTILILVLMFALALPPAYGNSSSAEKEPVFPGEWIPFDPGQGIIGGREFAVGGDSSSPDNGQAVELKLNLAEGYHLSPVYRDRTIYAFLDKRWAKWTVLKGEQQYGYITVIESVVAGGDYYYLVRYEPLVDGAEIDPSTWMTSPVTSIAQLGNGSDDLWESHLPLFFVDVRLTNVKEPFVERHAEYPGEIEFDKSVWQESSQVENQLPRFTAVVENEQYSLWMSMNNVYRPMDKATLEEQYEQVQPTLYRVEELQVDSALSAAEKEGSPFAEEPGAEHETVTDGVFTLVFPQKKGLIGEQWSLVSTQPLIDWQHETAADNLQRADFNRARKWSIAGPYYKVPSSYYPYTEYNFWRRPAQHVGNMFLDKEGARLFQSFSLIALYNAVEIQNEKGYWWSTPRSEWLYRSYGIDSSFYDTRFNTDAALFLVRGYQKYPDLALLSAASTYAEFLMEYAETHHHRTGDVGILVYDYGHEANPQAVTHTSLNHHITEMNFLYEMYLLTGEEAYFKMAERMRQGVKDTVDGWKKENGDLQYAYLGNGRFGMQDYPTLTLNDLRYSQRLIQKVSGGIDPDFEQLIQWKVEFLNRSGK